MKTLDGCIKENGFYRLYAWGRDGRRVKLLLDETDANKTMKHGVWRDDVINHADGRRLRIRSASCGLAGCMCDLVIVKEYGVI